MSSPMRFATFTAFALVLAPLALACSAGGGTNDDDVIPSGPGEAPSPGTTGLGNNPTLVPPVTNTPGTNLGATSEEEDAECDNVLEVTYRDFSESHPDFEMPFSGDVVRLTLVKR